MKVFISWSGPRSKAVAEVFKDWIACVIQSVKPWYSPEDIEGGAQWFNEINSGLKDTAIGVIFLTQDNKDKPWILFEAGALAKGLSGTRVCPVLIDLKSTDVVGPLNQLNHTQPTEEDMFKLVKMINKQLGEKSLKTEVLSSAFEIYWPQFKKGFDEAVKNNTNDDAVINRTEHDLLNELLMASRGINRRLDDIERKHLNEERAFNPRNKDFLKDVVRQSLRDELNFGKYIDNMDCGSMEVTIIDEND